MRKMIVVLIVVFTFCCLSPELLKATSASPTPILAVRMDGTNKPKKRKKSSAKPQGVAIVSAANSKPIGYMYGIVGGKQVIINIFFYQLIKQQMAQKGDSNVVPLQKDGSLSSVFDFPKDQELAERIIRELHTEQARFYVIPATKSSVGQNTIVLNKASWSEAELDAACKLIGQIYAPVTVEFIPTPFGTKIYELPPLFVGQNTTNR